MKKEIFSLESFGLFQILQSFLGQNPQNAPDVEIPDVDESAHNAPESAPKTSERESALSEAQQEADPSTQAILSFMQAHETRAKRIKKS